jgi:hypothetical protein
MKRTDWQRTPLTRTKIQSIRRQVVAEEPSFRALGFAVVDVVVGVLVGQPKVKDIRILGEERPPSCVDKSRLGCIGGTCHNSQVDQWKHPTLVLNAGRQMCLGWREQRREVARAGFGHSGAALEQFLCGGDAPVAP